MIFNLYIILRRIIYITLGIIGRVFRVSDKNVVVFCYHSVAEDSWRFSTNLDELKKQINYLSHHRRAITAQELTSHINGVNVINEPAFLITFDDGYRDILRTKEYFKERGIKPVALIMGDSLNANQSELDTNRPFLTSQEIHELNNYGWDIGCHSMTHRDFSTMSQEERVKEIVNSKVKLESDLGVTVKYFAYPKGVYSDDIIKSVRDSGYSIGFSMDEGFVRVGDEPMRVSRIGVDRTHAFTEFIYLTSPLVISFRRGVKYLGALLGN